MTTTKEKYNGVRLDVATVREVLRTIAALREELKPDLAEISARYVMDVVGCAIAAIEVDAEEAEKARRDPFITVKETPA